MAYFFQGRTVSFRECYFLYNLNNDKSQQKLQSYGFVKLLRRATTHFPGRCDYIHDFEGRMRSSCRCIFQNDVKRWFANILSQLYSYHHISQVVYSCISLILCPMLIYYFHVKTCHAQNHSPSQSTKNPLNPLGTFAHIGHTGNMHARRTPAMIKANKKCCKPVPDS